MKEEFDGYPQEQQGEDNDINGELHSVILERVYSKCKRNWKIILSFICIFSAAGLVIGFSLPKEYTVVSKIAPELTSSATNRLSSLTTMLGMNANILGSTDAVYPMVYPDIIGSTDFIVGLFDVKVPYQGDTITIYDFYLNHQKTPWWSAVTSFPGTVISWFKDDEEEQTETSAVDPFQLTKEQYGIYKAVSGGIKVELDKKTLSITTNVKTQDPVVSAILSKSINNQLKKTVENYRTEKAKKDMEYYAVLYEEAKNDYYVSQRRYADYLDRNQGLITRKSQTESERLKNEMNLKFQLYNSVSQQFQNAKGKVQLETPVLAEVIPPTVPLRPSGPSKKRILAFFFVLGLTAGIGTVLLKK